MVVHRFVVEERLDFGLLDSIGILAGLHLDFGLLDSIGFLAGLHLDFGLLDSIGFLAGLHLDFGLANRIDHIDLPNQDQESLASFDNYPVLNTIQTDLPVDCYLEFANNQADFPPPTNTLDQQPVSDWKNQESDFLDTVAVHYLIVTHTAPVLNLLAMGIDLPVVQHNQLDLRNCPVEIPIEREAVLAMEQLDKLHPREEEHSKPADCQERFLN